MKLNVHNANVFAKHVKQWHAVGHRDYPWRETRDPYRILIAELMLRRTRADQVVPVYANFLKRYPDCRAFCKGNAETIRRILKPLGLKWRAENFVKISREIKASFNCAIPDSTSLLKQLTGVGDYVAGAVCCFAYGLPVALVDTNIVRVIGRVFGLDISGEARRRKSVKDAARTCLDRRRPKEYHFALLDFGALVCTASAPKCGECLLGSNNLCEFYSEKS